MDGFPLLASVLALAHLPSLADIFFLLTAAFSGYDCMRSRVPRWQGNFVPRLRRIFGARATLRCSLSLCDCSATVACSDIAHERVPALLQHCGSCGCACAAVSAHSLFFHVGRTRRCRRRRLSSSIHLSFVSPFCRRLSSVVRRLLPPSLLPYTAWQTGVAALGSSCHKAS